MLFSIIIPSFNQEKYIRKTIENVVDLKRKAFELGIKIEVLIFDNESKVSVQKIIAEYKQQIDFISVEKDLGQFDAINKGLKKISGEYWTWLNTDDTIDSNGFLKLVEILKNDRRIDYIYGSIQMIDEKENFLKILPARHLSLERLLGVNAGIFQPGSFFKKKFTDKIGLLESYDCCFDYEYILRLLKANAKIFKCNFPVANFRFYPESKSGSASNKFIDEQLIISKIYGRKVFSLLTVELNLRKIKRRIFN